MLKRIRAYEAPVIIDVRVDARTQQNSGPHQILREDCVMDNAVGEKGSASVATARNPQFRETREA
eukprot:4088998-Pyramimonas_sp.AAC.3